MPGMIQRFGKFGTATTVFFSLEDPLATGSDKFVTGTIAGLPIVAGDVKISKDGGAVVDTTNLPTQVTAAQPFYALVVTATEMQAESVDVVFQDQTAPAAWRSLRVNINTRLRLGQLDIDATQIGGNTSALVAQGVGTSPGFSSTGGTAAPGATFTGQGANAGFLTIGGNTAPSYGIECRPGTAGGAALFANAAAAAGTNSSGISALGVGSSSGLAARGGATGDGIHGIGGSTSGIGIRGTATSTDQWNNIFEVTEGAEPAAGAVPNNATIRRSLQYLKRRFFDKVTQTISTQSLFGDDNVTVLTTMAVSDDGTTQTKAKSA